MTYNPSWHKGGMEGVPGLPDAMSGKSNTGHTQSATATQTARLHRFTISKYTPTA